MSEFTDKAVLVTGAGSGIGRAVALAFAAEGARVMVCDINATGGAETVSLIEAAGAKARFQEVNVAEESSVTAMVAATVAEFGRLDCAVNSAAIDPEIDLEPKWNLSEMDRILSINLRGTILCLKSQIEAMRQSGGGAIVNFASFAGVAGVPSKPFYTAAKHGVVGLTRSVGLDQAKYGIRVNAICPGFIKTPMALANTDKPGVLEAIMARNPTRRVGEAGEVAATTLFLCSEKAGFIIGQAISIDGGISAQ
jgi:NAD(P)-dependent dehydrogenase (short-subunit alcohol dehydrogenase family)